MTLTPETGAQLSEPSSGDDDAQLAARVARGDRSAAEALILRHQAPVRGFLRKITGRDDLADDLAQETFLRLLRHAGSYDPRYPMRSWLLTIARRLSINLGRRAERKNIALAEYDTQSPDDGPAQQAADNDQQRTLRRHLDAALGHLPEAQRAALVLFHQQGLSIQEVAEVMKVPTGTVKSHLHRGRMAMRNLLGAEPEVVST
ncbi:MAG: RNA polymerase sigma factor [Phycisphaeraceae bacterium]